MFTLKKNISISVFFDGPKDNPAGPSESAAKNKPSEATETVDKTKLDTLTKEMLEEFLGGKNRNEATELLKKYKEKLKRENTNPKLLEILEQRERTLIIWSNFNGILFGSSPDGEKKEVSKGHQDALVIALGISGKEITFPQKTESSKPETIVKETQKIEDPKLNEFLNNNPIDTYKSKWIEACLKHPQQIKDNMIGQGARRLGGNVANSLQDELKILQELGKELPVEYKTLIGTLINVTKSLEFGRYTGFFSEGMQKSIGRDANMEEFQKNFRNFMDVSIKERKTLTKEDFDNFFNKKRELTPEEEKYVEDSYQKIQDELKNISGKEKQLARLDEIIKVNLASNNPHAVITKLNEKLHSLTAGISTAPEGGFFAELSKKLSGSNETKENWEIAQKEANEQSKKEGQQFFVRFNTEQNKYEVIPESYIREQFSQKDMGDIEKTMFQSLVASHGWQGFFEKIGEEGTAAVGAYISTYPDTVLFQNMDSAKAAEVKSFFDKSYHATITEQGGIINKEKPKFEGKDFGELFPSLKNNPKITEEMQKALIEGNIENFYNLLAQKKEKYGAIRDIMKQVEKDANGLSERLAVKIIKGSEQFKGKKLKDYSDIFILDTDEKKRRFELIKDKNIGNGDFTSEENKFLLSITDQKYPLYDLLSNHSQQIRVNHLKGASNQAAREASKQPIDKPAEVLSVDARKRMNNAGNVSVAIGEEKIRTELSNKNSDIPGIEQFNDISSISREIHGLKSLGELSEQDQKKLTILESRLRDKERIAIAVNSYVRSPGMNEQDAIEFIRETTGKNLSDKDMKQWIEGQQYISRYVAERKDSGSPEEMIAHMNSQKPYVIGDFYNSSDSSQNTLSDFGFNTANGMSELMQCKIEIGDAGYLTRTIRNPEGEIIAKNIPLEHIDNTLEQLGRIYSIGLGTLAPNMGKINASISSVRPDAIGGTDGTYSQQEDEKFLTIMATMLYGKENIPKERNIPNLLHMFNRAEKEYNPSFILKQKGILDENGTVQTTQLENSLKEASKEIPA